MKRIFKWVVCVFWESQHDYQQYHGGYEECICCGTGNDTWR